MKIKMRVSISSNQLVARIGQEIEVQAKLGHELIQNEQAEPMDVTKLPRAQSGSSATLQNLATQEAK